MGWLPNRLPTACGLALERGASLSGLSVAWLERGPSACRSGIRHARHVLHSRTNDLERVMTVVMIGVDPHKATHTAVVIGPAEEPLGDLRGRAAAGQAEQPVARAPHPSDRGLAV